MNLASESIVMAMSGGLDSSVSAMLLVEAGYQVRGIHLRLWPHGDDPVIKTAQESHIEDARIMCKRIGIEFEVLDFQERFEREVVQPFIEEYRLGRTPNPCIICNPRIKFGALMNWAVDQGAAAMATGHYVKIEQNPDTKRWHLRRGFDDGKDQSYFLCRLSQEQLSRFRAPLGAMTKPDVRELARARGLHVAEKSESQEICFIADDKYQNFLEARIGTTGEDLSGDIVDLDGKGLGQHSGIHRYTIGQRRGMGVSAPNPLYVIEIRAKDNTIVVGPTEALDHVALETGTPSWGALPGLDGPVRCRAKIRYRTPSAPATITPTATGVHVQFDEMQRAITPGQTVAFYDEADQIVLGGATIEKPL